MAKSNCRSAADCHPRIACPAMSPPLPRKQKSRIVNRSSWQVRGPFSIRMDTRIRSAMGNSMRHRLRRTRTVRQPDAGSQKRLRIILKLVRRAVRTKNPIVLPYGSCARGTGGSNPSSSAGESVLTGAFHSCRRIVRHSPGVQAWTRPENRDVLATSQASLGHFSFLYWCRTSAAYRPGVPAARTDPHISDEAVISGTVICG